MMTPEQEREEREQRQTIQGIGAFLAIPAACFCAVIDTFSLSFGVSPILWPIMVWSLVVGGGLYLAHREPKK